MQANSDQLQEWLERFSERLKSRITSVTDEVEQVLEQMGAVELDLKNTFNSFRNLSSSQFIENRVYEEDETESISVETPQKDVRQSSMPTESYEDEILPRYKEAVATAWAAFQNHRHDQASLQTIPWSSKRHFHGDNSTQILPYIVGTEEFARDINSGLGELRRKPQVANDSEFDSDMERDGASLAAELIGTEILSEWSGTDSDASGFQEGSFEPAVSAALDFKAMLEAALRNPSLHYDGGALDEVDNAAEQFVDDSSYVPNLAAESLSNSTRTISRNVESENDETGGNISEASDNILNKYHLPTSDQLPPEVLAQSPLVGNGDQLKFLQPEQDNHTYSRTIQELLKQRFDSQSQIIPNQEHRPSLPGDEGNMPNGSSGLSHVPNIPGGLFDDDDDEGEISFLTREYVVVSNTNTEPTIPEGLFQKQPPLDAFWHAKGESPSTSSVESSEERYQSQASLTKAAKDPLHQDVDNSIQHLQRKASNESYTKVSSIPRYQSQASLTKAVREEALRQDVDTGHLEREASDKSDLKVSSIPRYQSQASLTKPVKDPLGQDVDTSFRQLDRPVSNKSDSKVSSMPKQPNLPPLRSSISSRSNVNIASNPLLIRGGLFDDDDDEDDDSSLFGSSEIRVESRHAAHPWDSGSNKGLVDGVEDTEAKERDVANWTLEEMGSSSKFQINNDSSQLQSENEMPSGNEVVDLDRQPSFPVETATSSGGSNPDVIASRDAEDFESISQSEGRVNRPRQLPIHSILAQAMRSSVKRPVDSDDDSNDTWSSSGSEDENAVTGKTHTRPNAFHNSGHELLMTGDSGPHEGETGGHVIDFETKPPFSNEHLGPSLFSTESSVSVALPADGEHSGHSSQIYDEELTTCLPITVSRSLSAPKESPERVAITLDESPLLGSSKEELSDAEQKDEVFDSSSIEEPQLVHNSLLSRLGPPLPKQHTLSSGTGFVETPTFISKYLTEAENLSSDGVKQKSSSVATNFTKGPWEAKNLTTEASMQKTNLSTDSVAMPVTSTVQNPLGASNVLIQSTNLSVGIVTTSSTSQPQNPLEAKKTILEDGVESLSAKSRMQNKSKVSNVMSEGLIQKTSKSDLTASVSESGRLTTRRTFTSLFEDDDDSEDDLFGPKQQGGLFAGTGRNKTWLLSNATVVQVSGREEVGKSEPPLRIEDTSSKLPGPSNPTGSLPFHSLIMYTENEDGIQAVATSSAQVKPTIDLTFHPKLTLSEKGSGLPMAKPVSKLSSLLFGDDDEDEDALFGPLGGRISRGSNSTKSEKVASLFGDTKLTRSSSRRASGKSLFDDLV